MKAMNVRITLVEGMLGTSPANEDIYRDFIGSKSPDAATVEDEVVALGVDAVVEKGMTVFPRDEDGRPFLYDYQIKGFFKDTCSALARVKPAKGEKAAYKSATIKAYKKVIDGLIFPQPRKIAINVNGEIGICQRPLRAQTMQGERVALAMSEEVPAGSTMEFSVLCVDDAHEELVREWLDFGILRGFGQWRNSGKGRFTWEDLDA